MFRLWQSGDRDGHYQGCRLPSGRIHLHRLTCAQPHSPGQRRRDPESAWGGGRTQLRAQLGRAQSENQFNQDHRHAGDHQREPLLRGSGARCGSILLRTGLQPDPVQHREPAAPSAALSAHADGEAGRWPAGVGNRHRHSVARHAAHPQERAPGGAGLGNRVRFRQRDQR